MKLALSACFGKPEQFLPSACLCIRHDQKLWFIDGKRKGRKYVPLLVAHSDTVQPAKYHGKALDGKHIFASGLDDRLGIYLALAVQSARPWVDVLITEGEEEGRSSGRHLKTEEMQGYSCALNLDRAGLDYVDYGLASPELAALIESAGYEPGFGSFSDICQLPTACAMANLGTGCQDGHSFGSYVAIADLQTAYSRIISIIDKIGESYFPAPERKPDFGNRYQFGALFDYDPIGYTSQEDFDKIKSEHGPRLDCAFCGFDLQTRYEREAGLCMDCIAHEESALFH